MCVCVHECVCTRAGVCGVMVSVCVRGLSFIESLFGVTRILELRPNHLFPKQRDSGCWW